MIAQAQAPDAEGMVDPMPSAKFLWQAVNQARPVQFDSANGAYFVMQLFVGEPLFLVTGHAVDLRVVDYIKSIEFAGNVLFADRIRPCSAASSSSSWFAAPSRS